MVSLLIGSKGRQINSIMKESKTEIIVNQPIFRMRHRTVKIDGIFALKLRLICDLFKIILIFLLGKPNNISKATELIYNILEEKAHQVTNIEKEPATIDLKHIKITVRF